MDEKYQDRIRLRKGEEKGGSARSGRFGHAIRSMGEVAQIMGLTRARVHQIERTALWKLRQALAPYRE